MSNPLKSDLREARKRQTIRETTFAMRGNNKPFGKRLSPCAETSNYSGNNSRHARKHQTMWETTFAMRGNTKPFRKRLPPSAETPNLLRNELREARKVYKQKSTLKKCIFKVLYKRRRLPTLPHCIAVPSAQVGLTSLFGMGRGGTPPQ